MNLRLPDSWSNWNLEMLVFEERGKPEYPEKNLSEQRRTNNKHNPQMASTPRFEPWPHWWKASALTTEPPRLILLSYKEITLKRILSAKKKILFDVSFAVCVSRVLHTTRNGGHENQGRANYCIFNVSSS